MADSDALIGKTVSPQRVQEKLGGGTIELWRFDADGQNGTKIADDVVTSDCSPDGNWAAFTNSNRKFYRISPQGGTSTELVIPPKSAVTQVRISPFGKSILYILDENGMATVKRIAIVRANGGKPLHPFDYPGRAVAVQWSLDGNGVQYLSTSGGATNVWAFPLTGGAAHRVTNFTSGTIFDFAWTRDGKRLFLAKGDVPSDGAMCVFASSAKKPRPAAQCGHRLTTGRRYQSRLGHLGESSSFGRFARNASRHTEFRCSEQQSAVPGSHPKRFEK